MPLSSDSSTYATFLFNAFDTDHDGSVSFEVRFFLKKIIKCLLRYRVERCRIISAMRTDEESAGTYTAHFNCLRCQQKHYPYQFVGGGSSLQKLASKLHNSDHRLIHTGSWQKQLLASLEWLTHVCHCSKSANPCPTAPLTIKQLYLLFQHRHLSLALQLVNEAAGWICISRPL